MDNRTRYERKVQQLETKQREFAKREENIVAEKDTIISQHEDKLEAIGTKWVQVQQENVRIKEQISGLTDKLNGMVDGWGRTSNDNDDSTNSEQPSRKLRHGVASNVQSASVQSVTKVQGNSPDAPKTFGHMHHMTKTSTDAEKIVTYLRRISPEEIAKLNEAIRVGGEKIESPIEGYHVVATVRVYSMFDLISDAWLIRFSTSVKTQLIRRRIIELSLRSNPDHVEY